MLAASAFTAPAAAQTAGVGTSQTSTKVLTAQLGAAGALLDLALLVDEARSTTDSAVASPEAFTRLTALAAKSSIVPTSPVNVTEGVFEAKSSGPSEVTITGSTLAVPASVPAPLSPVLSGAIDPGKLTATLNQGVAASTMSTSVSGVKAVGGLVGIGSVKSVLDASSGTSSSSASRGASANDLAVLDLGSLLNGLGLSLGELPIDTLIALVDSLGVAGTLGLPTGSDTLDEAVDALNAAIDDLQGALDLSLSDPVTEAVDDSTSTLVGTVGDLVGTDLTLPTDTTTLVSAVEDLLNEAIDALQQLINDLLADGLVALDGLALLRLEGVEVGVTTKAVDSVAGSVAAVTGSIGKVHVGGIELAGIDLAGTAEQLSATLAAVNTQLGKVLAVVDPGLANLVKLSVLDKATSVTQDGAYTRSRAGITAATATITPPENLAAIVSGIIAATDDVTAQLTAAGVAVPQLDGLMNQLAGTLNLASSALTSPAKVQVASVLSASDFRLAAPGTPASTPTLPRTGGSDLVLFAGLLGVLALGIRRFTRAPEVKAIEVRR